MSKTPRIPPEMTLSAIKARLSEVVRVVENGGRVTITRHGCPVADLVPHDPMATVTVRVRTRPNRITPKPGPSAKEVVRELRGDR